MNLLQFHLKWSQQRMKQIANWKRSDKTFEVGDLMYLRLQPYRKHIMRKLQNQKLSPKFFGPFSMEAKVGSIPYKLALPTSS